MVPLNDENPIRITPIVTYTLIISWGDNPVKNLS
jgi:hypothetical protein